MALMRLVRRVTVRCPVAAETMAALLRGEMQALESDVHAARILAVIRADNPLGDFGLYRGVFEATLGIEGFMPTAGAVPTVGHAGVASLSPTVSITTYLDAGTPRAAIEAAIDALLAAHPWEIPVIELDREPIELPERR